MEDPQTVLISIISTPVYAEMTYNPLISCLQSENLKETQKRTHNFYITAHIVQCTIEQVTE